MRGASKWSFLVGLVTFCYTGTGFWHPSFWTDEAATVSAVTRTLPELSAMLGTVDAVHGAYYYFMFFWTSIFGYTEIALRLPSLLAISASAVLLVEIGRKIGSVRFGLFAAAFFTLLPRTQYVATDGRSYALTVLGAVAATYLLISLREGGRIRHWIAYSVTGCLLVSLSFYCILLLAVHAIAAVTDLQLRRQLKFMAVASVAWLFPAVYIAAIASQQQFQIAWIREVGPSFPFELAFLQFFADGYFNAEGRTVPKPTPGEDASTFVLSAMLWVAAGAGAVLARGHFVTRVALLWLIFPAAAVIGGSLLTGGNYYLPRYLSFGLPALPLLVAAPLLVSLRSPARARAVYRSWSILVAVCVLVTLPSYVGQRTEFGRDPEDDFRAIAQHVEELGEPGDGLVMGLDTDLAHLSYPEEFAELEDATLIQPAASWNRIFNQRGDVGNSKDRILQHATIILVEKSNKTIVAKELEKLGYMPIETLQGPSTRVTKYAIN